MHNIVGIDPGKVGAIVFLNKKNEMTFWKMPLDSEKKFDAIAFSKIVVSLPLDAIFVLEQALPLAMGSKHAFTYGREFGRLELVLELAQCKVTYIEPSKWTKIMHDGINKDLKPKAKSIIAVTQTYPQYLPLIPKTPKSGKLHEGVVDALLIAGYGKKTQ